MRSHLLNWSLGPALLGGFFASFGCAAADVPESFAAAFGVLRFAGGMALFFAGAIVILTTIMAVAQRFIEGKFNWLQVRMMASVLAVKMALGIAALALLMIVYQVAAMALGGWRAGWWAAVVGAVFGAAIGILVGTAVAWLRIPERLAWCYPELASQTPAGADRCNIQDPAE